MVSLAIWILASFLAWHGIIFVFTYSQALIGSILGASIQRISIGYSLLTPFFAEWKREQVEWKWSLFPLGGFVKFLGAENQEAAPHQEEIAPPKSFPALSPARQLLIIAIGPAATILLGFVLILISNQVADQYLVFSNNAEAEIQPSSMPNLSIQAKNGEFADRIAWIFDAIESGAPRYFYVQPLEGWGGWIGWIVTQGTVGRNSVGAWINMCGGLAIILGILNLLFIPGLAGFQLLSTIVDAFVGRQRMEKFWVLCHYGGLICLLLICFRLISADYYWVRSQIW